MKVAIGVVAGTVGGPATYGRELVRALARLPSRHHIVVLTDDPAAFRHTGLEAIAVPLRSPYEQPLWDHWRIPRLLALHDVDIYHGTKNVLPLWGASRSRRRQVVTIHDLAVYSHPQTFARAQRWHLRLDLPHTVRAADRIIADSEHARADILRHFGRRAEAVVTIPLGVAPEFRPACPDRIAAFRARRGLKRRIILYAGTVQPRKNVDLLVAAYRRLGDRWRATAGDAGAEGWDLVVAGRLRPGFAPAWLAEATTDGSPPQPGIVWAGSVPQDELALFYSAADVMVSPSAYEGFGLTVVEAMACGCPVVSVATSAVSEVADTAAVLIDAPGVEALVDAIDRVLGDGALRAELRARGLERARRFTWEEAASRTLAVYDELAGAAREGTLR